MAVKTAKKKSKKSLATYIECSPARKHIPFTTPRLASLAEVADLKPEDEDIDFPYSYCRRGDRRFGRIAVPGSNGEWFNGPWYVSSTYIDLTQRLHQTIEPFFVAAHQFMTASYYRPVISRFGETFRFEIEDQIAGFVFSSNSGVGVREDSPLVPLADTSSAYASAAKKLNAWVAARLIEIRKIGLKAR